MESFCEIVRHEMEQLPEQFREKLENVVVDVQTRPSLGLLCKHGLASDQWAQLFGYFEGQPLTEQAYGVAHPNRITVFKDPIEAASRSHAEVAYEIRRTLIHELAHHFGFSEDDLEDFESRPSPFDADDE